MPTLSNPSATRVVLQRYANGQPTGPEIEATVAGGSWTANLQKSSTFIAREYVQDQPSRGPGPSYVTTDSSSVIGEPSSDPPDDANLPSTVLQADLSTAEEGDVLTIDSEGNIVAAPPAP